MATERAKAKSVLRSTTGSRSSTTISPQAMLAWSRIPTQSKEEILATFRHSPQRTNYTVKTVKVGTQLLNIRKMPSGFRVVFESENDHDTIVSILTPREARLAGD